METGSGPYRKTQMSFHISQLHRAYSYIFTPQLPIVRAIGLITLEQPNCQCRRIIAQGSWISSVQSLSRVQLFATPWTILSMKFYRPEYWSGQPFPSPGDLPNPGIKPGSPALQADSLPTELSRKPIRHSDPVDLSPSPCRTTILSLFLSPRVLLELQP